jgi:hypothetical protein
LGGTAATAERSRRDITVSPAPTSRMCRAPLPIAYATPAPKRKLRTPGPIVTLAVGVWSLRHVAPDADMHRSNPVRVAIDPHW